MQKALADLVAGVSGGAEVMRSSRGGKSVPVKPQGCGTVEHQEKKGVRPTSECGLRLGS